MREPRFPITLCRMEHAPCTLEGLAARTGVHPGRIQAYMAYGLLEPIQPASDQPLFDAACMARLQKIERLRRDLGVNLAGIAVILDLLDRLSALQREAVYWRARA
jgi:DNA-binding transcriptional MerR regulator